MCKNFIKLYDKKRTYYYKIIKEGTYPFTNQLHYTRNPKHPIPHNYIVETQYGKARHTVKCSINYVEGKPLFKVHFGAKFAKEVHSLESSTEAACKYYQVSYNDLYDINFGQLDITGEMKRIEAVVINL